MTDKENKAIELPSIELGKDIEEGVWHDVLTGEVSEIQDVPAPTKIRCRGKEVTRDELLKMIQDEAREKGWEGETQ